MRAFYEQALWILQHFLLTNPDLHHRLLSVSSISALGCTADDGASVNSVSATGPLVTFGNLSGNIFYQGCQDLSVSTNAGGGYSLAVQENHAMMTANGLNSIPDTTCDSGNCSSVSSGKWVTATNYGLGHTCLDQLGHDCLGLYSSGTLFRPFANVAAGTTSPISFINSWGLADGACNGSSCSLTVSPHPGDTLLVGIEYRSDFANLNSVSDNNSETYAQIFSDTNLGTHYANTLYCLAGITSGVTAVTVQYSAAQSSNMLVAEYSGVSCNVDALSAPTNHQQGTGTAHAWWTSNAITPAAGQSELMFNLDENNNGSHPLTFTATAAGFSAVRASGSNNDEAYVFASHRIVASTSGSYTSSGAADSATNSGANDPWIVAFKAATPQTGETIMSSSTPAIATGRVKYRLSVPTSQTAGTYANTIVYTIYAAY